MIRLGDLLGAATRGVALVGLAAGLVRAQSVQRPLPAGGLDPSCGAEVCADEAALAVAVDFLLRASALCRNSAQIVLVDELFLQPTQANVWEPSGEGSIRPVGTASGYGLRSFRRYRLPVVVEPVAKLRARPSLDATCIVTASPVQWVSEGVARIEMLEQREDGHFLQRFVFVEREGARWGVRRHEIGLQS